MFHIAFVQRIVAAEIAEAAFCDGLYGTGLWLSARITAENDEHHRRRRR
jgi:hypothetical protein